MSHSSEFTKEEEPIRFTEEGNAKIRQGMKDIAENRVYTTEEVKTFVRENAAEWIKQENHLSA